MSDGTRLEELFDEVRGLLAHVRGLRETNAELVGALKGLLSGAADPNATNAAILAIQKAEEK